MYIVKKKPLTPNMIWDDKKKQPLCRFVKGVLETEDSALAKKLEKMGYDVQEIKPPKETDGGSGEKEPEKKTGGEDGK